MKVFAFLDPDWFKLGLTSCQLWLPPVVTADDIIEIISITVLLFGCTLVWCPLGCQVLDTHGKKHKFPFVNQHGCGKPRKIIFFLYVSLGKPSKFNCLVHWTSGDPTISRWRWSPKSPATLRAASALCCAASAAAWISWKPRSCGTYSWRRVPTVDERCPVGAASFGEVYMIGYPLVNIAMVPMGHGPFTDGPIKIDGLPIKNGDFPWLC